MWLLRIFVALSLLVTASASTDAPSMHEAMDPLQLHHIFGTKRKENVPIYWLDSPKRSADEFSVSIDGELFEFKLKPHKMLIGSAVHSTEAECVFQGYGTSHNGTFLSLTGCGRRMRALIVSNDGSYFLIHPLSHEDTVDGHHVIHKRSADLGDKHECLFDPKDDPFPEDRFARSIFGGFNDKLTVLRDEVLTIELAVFADDTMWSHFRKLYGNDADEELHRFIVAVVNNIDILFRHSTISPKVTIKIVKYEVMKMPPPSMSRNFHRNGDVDRLLESFCDYQHSINPPDDNDPRHWDHALLFSGYDLYRDNLKAVAGYAPVKGMCSGIRSCTINEGLDFGSVFVVTHEMGHSLGMYHDGDNECDLRCCIMSPSVGTGKTEWSQCSVKELNVFVHRLGQQNRAHNCLRDDPLAFSTDSREHNSIIDRNVQLYPGQDYPVNEQCTIFHGECWKHELRDGQTLKDVCEMVWCGNNEGIIRTAHPALEGTYCGNGSYCIGGKCVPAPSNLRAVHGQWSEWNEMSSCGMGCSDCAIEGQLRVRRSVRMCDHPSPNNGGAPCDGAPLRAIRCHRRVCKGATIQDFATSVCTQYRDNPTNPLKHLTGKGFQFEQGPCKIWCFMSRNNIRTITNFPDGTPCGSNKYCVQGECMNLACGGKSLVNSTSDCPVNPPELSIEELSHSVENHTSAESIPFGVWVEWSAWSDCTASLCNSFGVTQRTRHCSSERCVGSPKQRAVCRGPSCAAKLLSEWTHWSACSVSCGENGVQHRAKTNCSQDSFCTERRACSSTVSCHSTIPQPTVTTPTPTTTFTEQPRTTTVHLQLSKPHVPDLRAGLERISLWSSWNEWSTCSATCGQGVKVRTRKCEGEGCPGMGKDMRWCIKSPCIRTENRPSTSVWRSWSPWSGCSRSCGGGLSRRYRICQGFDCTGPATEYRKCAEQPCP